MKCLAALLLCAAAARAQTSEEVLRHLEREEWKEAGLLVDRLLIDLPENRGLLEMRARAHRGIARDLQREKGYDAAIAHFEKQGLSHWILAQAYAETCMWAGRETHGLKTLRACGLPLAYRIQPELRLLHVTQRYDELAARAKQAAGTVTWDALAEWERSALEEAALRRRLAQRADRARTVAIVAALVLVAAGALLWRLAPTPRPPP